MQTAEEQTGARERFLSAIQNLTELAAVESLIKSKLSAEAGMLVEISNYLLSLGGKRMRPALALLVYRLLAGSDSAVKSELLDIAAGIELIHMATLLHDDIIDNSPLRRHKDSPYQRYGLPQTLLTGDFLLVRAFSMCARLDATIIDATEVACIELTEGEILETPLYETTHSVESYLTIAKKKTAALFRLAAESASHIAGGNPELSAHFAAFGEDLGISFQILDDILDVTSSDTVLGKQAGTDLRERKPSIINILWLNSGSSLAKKLQEKPGVEEDQFIAEAMAELQHGPVIDEARALARQFAGNARMALREGCHCAKNLGLPLESAYWDGLESLLDYTLERVM